MSLEKAICQDVLTLDTVDAQFCSDHLKEQIKKLIKERDQLQMQVHEGYEWSSKEIGKRDDQLASAAYALEGLLDRKSEESIRRAQEVVAEIRDEEANVKR